MNVVIDVYGLSDGDDIYNHRYEAIEGMCAMRFGENVGISTNPTILTICLCNSVGSECHPYKVEVTGSSPVRGTTILITSQ